MTAATAHPQVPTETTPRAASAGGETLGTAELDVLGEAPPVTECDADSETEPVGIPVSVRLVPGVVVPTIEEQAPRSCSAA